MKAKLAGLFRHLTSASAPITVPPSPVLPNPKRDFHGLDIPETLPAGIAHPTREAIGYVDAVTVVAGHREEIEQVLSAFVGTANLPDFSRNVVELIRRLADYVTLLPASRAHHHCLSGGLFAHSLDVAHKALHLASSQNVTHDSPARLREADNLAWQLAVFTTALLHDIGKVHSLGRVQAMTVNKPAGQGGYVSVSAPAYPVVWRPIVCSMEDWAKAFAVQSFFIDFEEKATRQHPAYFERYFMQIVPAEIRAYLWASNPRIVGMLEDFLASPMGASTKALFRIVKDADEISVMEATDPQTIPGTISLSGHAIRRLMEFAAEQPWNLPHAPFIRAHVQLPTDADRERVVQLSFFVATRENIERFLQFFESREGGRLSLGRADQYGNQGNLERLVFTALETTGVFLRSIPGILDEQRAIKELAPYVPASRGQVLFSPVIRLPEGGIMPATGKPMEMSLPLIALGAIVTHSVPRGMPTLSFHGSPKQAFTSSLPVRIEKGKVLPENPLDDEDLDIQREIEALVQDLRSEGAKASSPLPAGPQRAAIDPESLSGATAGMQDPRAGSIVRHAVRDSRETSVTTLLERSRSAMGFPPDHPARRMGQPGAGLNAPMSAAGASAPEQGIPSPASGSSDPEEGIWAPASGSSNPPADNAPVQTLGERASEGWKTAWLSDGPPEARILATLFLLGLTGDSANCMRGAETFLLDRQLATTKGRDMLLSALRQAKLPLDGMTHFPPTKGLELDRLPNLAGKYAGHSGCVRLRGPVVDIIDAAVSPT